MSSVASRSPVVERSPGPARSIDPELAISVIPPDVLAFGPKIAPGLATSNLLAVVMFALLAYSLYHFARKKLN